MGRINVNIYNQDEYRNDSQPCQQQHSSKPSVNYEIFWIPVAVFMSIFLTVGLGSSRYSGGNGSSPVIINNR